MIKILKHTGGVLLFSVVAFTVLFISLNVHLSRDDYRPRDRRTELTHSIGTSVYKAYMRLPSLLAYARGRNGSAGNLDRSLFRWTFACTVLYGGLTYAAVVGIRRGLKCRTKKSFMLSGRNG
jgi:hypothetical protein